jgi:thioredoxin reductase (NADPH)
MKKGAERFGAVTKFGTVKAVELEGKVKKIELARETLYSKTVIIATGADHRELGIEGEKELVGRGVSYCAHCDANFFRGKTVAVIGGGNSALQEALLLSEGCRKVYVIQNLDVFTGEASLVNRLREKSNVEFIMGTVVTDLVSDGELRAIRIKSNCGQEDELKVDGMFVAIGLIPNNAPFSALAELNDYGYFASDETCITKTAGVFVAGDCRSKTIRQVTTATADGASAALAACRYLDR